ncbi:MAG: GNAT family N-acetyltransferase [Acidimicrobiia bacterium]|nr:MAG: GNAT family N-acetyltransferase [Acidimicrobiia bacterium]
MTSWSLPDELEATAPLTGPFPLSGFVAAWWGAFGVGDPVMERSEEAAFALVVDRGTARLPGDADLTDYHSPLGQHPESVIAATVSMLDPGTRLVLDSLPREALEAVTAGLEVAGLTVSSREHAVAMVLDLPADPDLYLARLDAKQRHEVRRKRRRFVDAAGEPRLVRDASLIDRFVSMHRAAEGDKGGFMTPSMEGFFGSLLNEAGAVLDVLVDGEGRPVAAAFGFEDDRAYYLYNSAFDPEHGGISPGVVLVHALVERTIASGRTRFDFLKGSESYKGRLGAEPRPLFVVEAAV